MTAIQKFDEEQEGCVRCDGDYNIGTENLCIVCFDYIDEFGIDLEALEE